MTAPTAAVMIEACLAGDAGTGSGGRGDVSAELPLSQPVTATIVVQLLEAGVISSLDDPVTRYSNSFNDATPPDYAGLAAALMQITLNSAQGEDG